MQSRLKRLFGREASRLSFVLSQGSERFLERLQIDTLGWASLASARQDDMLSFQQVLHRWHGVARQWALKQATKRCKKKTRTAWSCLMAGRGCSRRVGRRALRQNCGERGRFLLRAAFHDDNHKAHTKQGLFSLCLVCSLPQRYPPESRLSPATRAFIPA